jgi:putative intracellular protease/amidase
MTREILVVLTNVYDLRQKNEEGVFPQVCDKIDSHSPVYTGFDIYHVAYIWEFLGGMGIPITFASIKGGRVYIDQSSMELAKQDVNTREFLQDQSLMDSFGSTKSLNDVNPQRYSAVLVPGGRGALVDLCKSTRLSEVISQVYYEKNGVVATIGHGAAALLGLRSAETREPFVKDREITAFTDQEEKQHGLSSIVPYSLEYKLRILGSKFENVSPFNSCVIISQEQLITGQNSQSSYDWVISIAKSLGLL